VEFHSCDAIEPARSHQIFPSPKECVGHFLTELRQEIARLHVYGVTRVEVEHRRREVELRRRSVPDSPMLDQMLRHLASVICIGNRVPRSARGWRKPTRGATIHISLDSAVKLASRAKPKCRAKTVRAKQLPKYLGHQSNGIPVFLEMPRSCLTTGKIRGTPFSRRIRSASRSGSPGIRGPLVPGAGFVARKTRM
jgi:hypothetical protein